jgi:hypothetical protein
MGFIGLLAGLAMMMACSGTDLLDEEETRYNAYATPMDGEEEREEIDIVFRDCDDNLSTDDGEVNYPFDVMVTIESDATTGAEFRVDGYLVEFRPNHASYWEVSIGQPEDLEANELPSLLGTVLNPIEHHQSVALINAGDTLSVSLNVWNYWDKIYFKDTVLHDFNPPFGQLFGTSPGGQDFFEEDLATLTYDMRVILYCTTIEDDEFEIVTPWTPVNFADVETCSG